MGTGGGGGDGRGLAGPSAGRPGAARGGVCRVNPGDGARSLDVARRKRHLTSVSSLPRLTRPPNREKTSGKLPLEEPTNCLSSAPLPQTVKVIDGEDSTRRRH